MDGMVKMRFALNSEQQQMSAIARDYFSRIQEGYTEANTAFDRVLWADMNAALGIQGLSVPEQLGGSGASTVTLATVFEAAGMTLYAGPLLSSVGWATSLLVAVGPKSPRLLEQLVSGECVAAVVADSSVRIEAGIVSGSAKFVVDAAADFLLIITSDGGMAYVPSAAEGVSIEYMENLDATRPISRVLFDGASSINLAGDASDEVAHATARAQALLAAEASGGAAACVAGVIEHAKSRRQFGTSIGSFQAVQHRIAEMHLDVEQAWTAAMFAAWCADEDTEGLRWAAPLALATATTAYKHCARSAIQLYGGMGFTWEHDAHRHFRRATVVSHQFGNHRTLHERILSVAVDQESW